MFSIVFIFVIWENQKRTEGILVTLEPDKEDIGKFIKYIPIQKDEYLETFSKRFNPLVSKSILSSWEKRHFLPNYEKQYKFMDNLEVYEESN